MLLSDIFLLPLASARSLRGLLVSDYSLPWTYTSSLQPYSPAAGSDSFVCATNGKFYLDELDYTFATFNAPGLFSSNQFEVEDLLRTFTAFARPVTRSYTLSIASSSSKPENSHIQGWSNDTQDWIYNEAKFQTIDNVVDLCRQWGIKVIMPMITPADDGRDESMNYGGNWADLIRLYYGFSTYSETLKIDFWTDPNLIEALNMTKDPGKDYRQIPPPGNVCFGVKQADLKWTATIAQHIKSLAPKILVMDGSLSRNNFTESKWAIESLESPYVDVFSEHYYGNSAHDIAFNYQAMNNDSHFIRSYGKTFVIGEHGFYPRTEQWDEFYYLMGTNPVAGALVWSLRPHSSAGGFLTHAEGEGIFSYHLPGWSPPPVSDFDPKEYYVDRKTYQASYGIVNETLPVHYPIPNAPTMLPLNITQNATYLTWQGAAWAERYEIWYRAPGASKWLEVVDSLRDNVDAGNANWTVTKNFAKNGSLVMRGVSVDLQGGEWSNVLTL